MKNTIKSNEEINTLFKQGKRINTSLVAALYSKETGRRDHKGRVAFIAGKKLGNAVFRNRCKRVMREAVLQKGGPWNGFDVIFMARKRELATARPQELDEAFSSILGCMLREDT